MWLPHRLVVNALRRQVLILQSSYKIYINRLDIEGVYSTCWEEVGRYLNEKYGIFSIYLKIRTGNDNRIYPSHKFENFNWSVVVPVRAVGQNNKYFIFVKENVRDHIELNLLLVSLWHIPWHFPISNNGRLRQLYDLGLFVLPFWGPWMLSFFKHNCRFFPLHWLFSSTL